MKLRNICLGRENEENVSQFRYISKISDFESISTRKKDYKMLMESRGKLEKSQEKVREFSV